MRIRTVKPEFWKDANAPGRWRRGLERLANLVLDRPYADPDDAVAKEARAALKRLAAPTPASLTETGIDWPQSWTTDDIAWVKRQIIGEHLRASRSDPMAGHGPFYDADGVDVCTRCGWRSDEPEPLLYLEGESR